MIDLFVKTARGLAAVCLLFLLAVPATAGDTAPGSSGSITTHALSLTGEVKYGPDFPHYDYVNPDAPKGGAFKMAIQASFDSLNPFTLKGQPVSGLGMIYDTLMDTAYDEPATEYGLLAEKVEYAKDFSWSIYTLRENARWHDGMPITPEDVIWSLNVLKEGVPQYRHYYKNIVKVEKIGDRGVKFTYDQAGNRELPHITGQLTVLPKHYWTGTDKNGKARDITRSTLEPPLGSGPYRIASVEPGRNIVYERVPDYWGKDLPVNVGRHNFKTVEYDYYKNDVALLESFFTGDTNFRLENIAKNWATQYKDKDPVIQGKIKLETILNKQRSYMQGFVFNTRLPKFQDRRVREALTLAFNFEWENKNLFYGQYLRTNSYFVNSELASSGLPTGRELEILEPYRDQLPPEVFTKKFKVPSSDDDPYNRKNLQKAVELLNQAGWSLKNGVMTNEKTGEKLTIEFLIDDPSFERIIQPYIRDLKRIGVEATIRSVDSSQYQERLKNYDFEFTVDLIAQSASPGNEQREYWGSAAADRPGSRNLAGIKDPVIDALIDKVIYAKDRADLVAATHALDRVLLWGYYYVPHWYYPYDRVAYWSYLHHPEHMPGYYIGVPDIWWSSEGQAAQ